MFHNTTSLIPPDKPNNSSRPTETKHTLASPIIVQVTSWKMSDHHPGLPSEVDDYLIQITDGTLTYEPMGFANLPLRDTHLRQQIKNDATPPFTVLIVYEISIKTVGRAFPLGVDLLRYKVVRCPKLGHPKGLLRSSGRQVNLVGINKLKEQQCGNCTNNNECDQSIEDGMKRRLCRCRIQWYCSAKCAKKDYERHSQQIVGCPGIGNLFQEDDASYSRQTMYASGATGDGEMNVNEAAFFMHAVVPSDPVLHSLSLSGLVMSVLLTFQHEYAQGKTDGLDWEGILYERCLHHEDNDEAPYFYIQKFFAQLLIRNSRFYRALASDEKHISADNYDDPEYGLDKQAWEQRQEKAHEMFNLAYAMHALLLPEVELPIQYRGMLKEARAAVSKRNKDTYTTHTNTAKQQHKLFKQLRKKGHSTKEAMAMSKSQMLANGETQEEDGSNSILTPEVIQYMMNMQLRKAAILGSARAMFCLGRAYVLKGHLQPEDLDAQEKYDVVKVYDADGESNGYLDMLEKQIGCCWLSESARRNCIDAMVFMAEHFRMSMTFGSNGMQHTTNPEDDISSSFEIPSLFFYVQAAALGDVDSQLLVRRIHCADVPVMCMTCGRISREVMCCAGCQSVYYCSKICQRHHWKGKLSGGNKGRVEGTASGLLKWRTEKAMDLDISRNHKMACKMLKEKRERHKAEQVAGSGKRTTTSKDFSREEREMTQLGTPSLAKMHRFEAALNDEEFLWYCKDLDGCGEVSGLNGAQQLSDDELERREEERRQRVEAAGGWQFLKRKRKGKGGKKKAGEK